MARTKTYKIVDFLIFKDKMPKNRVNYVVYNTLVHFVVDLMRLMTYIEIITLTITDAKKLYRLYDKRQKYTNSVLNNS